MKFIENQEKFGLQYDLNLIAKEYKKLKIPREFDFIDFNRIEKNTYLIDMSERTLGKTTNYLLLSMIYNKLYGTQCAYIRERSEMIKPSNAEKLIDVIKNYNNGYYLKKITDGKYNSVYYHWKKFYFCHINENGERDETASEPFLYFLSIDEHETYKSTFNAPLCDIIIFDEFISKYYQYNSCFMFMDLLSTILRKRKSGKIIMLANNTNINSMWFEELTIAKQIRKLSKGSCIDVKTDGGTTISVRLMENKNIKEKEKHNSLYFAFNNPKLNAITGDDWQFTQVRHIEKDMEYEKSGKPLFIRIAPSEFLRLQFALYKDNTILLVTRATKIRDDDIVFTLKNKEDYKNGVFKFGTNKIKNAILNLIDTDNVYYATNENGADFLNFVKNVVEYDALE